MSNRINRMLLTGLLFCCATGNAAAQTAREPGSDLTVFLATMGPGAQVYEMFGHNAIWIHDASSGTTATYNYGVFDSTEENFLFNFIGGRMLYRMDISEMEREIYKYTQTNRTLQLQRLNLTPAQRDSLRRFLEWNWLEANRTYLYDYFRDNCSTRVRDALDRVLGGAIHSKLAGIPTGTTYASHSYRLTAHDPALFTGLMIGFGMETARPIDAWEESFLPGMLMEHLRGVTITDSAGNTMPLVSSEQILYQSTLPARPIQAPDRTIAYLVAGLVVATLIIALARAARTAGGARVLLALVIPVWGGVTAFFGALLLFLWLATDHQAAHRNMNLLLFNPLGMLLAFTAPAAIAGTGRTARIAFRTAIAVAAMALSIVIIKALPGVGQDNGPLVALLLPVHLAVAWVLYHAGTGAPSSRQVSSAAEPVPEAA